MPACNQCILRTVTPRGLLCVASPLLHKIPRSVPARKCRRQLQKVTEYMKHRCPHCGDQSISSWSKFNSSSLHPAICPSCKGHCKQHWAQHPLETLVLMFGVPAIFMWAFFIKSWWPIILLVISVVVISVLQFRYVPMVAVNVSLAKKQHWFAFGCLCVILIWLVSEAVGN